MSKSRLQIILLASLAAAIFAPSVGAYTTGEPQTQYFYFNYFFNPGGNVNECYAACVGSCIPACYAAAPAGMTNIDCGVCPGRCASTCPSYFTVGIKADDGYPIDTGGITAGDGTPLATDLPPAGVTDQKISCPPGQIPYSNLGCVDPNWKDNYCSGANQCGQCAGRGGCIWTGVSCVACNAPTCVFACPAGPRVVAQPNEIPAPTPGPTVAPRAGPAPAPTPVVTVIPLPTTIPTTTITPWGTPYPTTIVTVTPIPTVLPTIPPQPTPTPGPRCGRYSTCQTCAKAPKDKKGDSQCGWSDFAGACIDNEALSKVIQAGLKPGWVSDPKYCTEPPEVYCYKYSDCFSCAGNAGLLRRCQWSVKDDRCEPYDPLGDFRTENKTEANDILLPTFCPAADCTQYSECLPCVQNSACLWSRDDKSCVEYKGITNTRNYDYYPASCPDTKATPTVTPTPIPCPTGCRCDKQGRVDSCEGLPINKTGLLPIARVIQNAGAASSLQQVEQVTFNPAGPNSTYTLRGYRTGVFLYFIPMRMDITATMDAQTGTVEKIEQPWWSFLTG